MSSCEPAIPSMTINGEINTAIDIRGVYPIVISEPHKVVTARSH